MTDAQVIPLSEIISQWDKTETWVAISGHTDYEVSSWGRVRRGDRILRPNADGRYQFVSLSTRGVISTHRVHKLVINAFVGPAPFIDALAAHNDGDTSNNRASNLRWASAIENQADRIRHETKIQGSEVFGAKLDEASIPRIRERIASGERYPSIAMDYGVSISTISLIKRGRTWTHV